MIKLKIGKRAKTAIAIFSVLLMFSGVYGIIQDYHPSSASSTNSSPGFINPEVASQGFTGSTSTAISYYTSVSVSNSGTTDIYIPIDQNSSFCGGSFDNTNTWTLSSNSKSASITESMSGQPNYIYLASRQDTVEFDSIAFKLGIGNELVLNNPTQEIGTIYANLTIDGYTVSWSHVFDFCMVDNSYYAVITPQYNFYSTTSLSVLSDFSGASLKLTATSNSSLTYVDAPVSLFTTTEYQGQNVIESSISTSVDYVPLVEGYYYGTGSSTISVPSSETSFDVSWGSAINTCATYTVSGTGYLGTGSGGTFTGDATHGTTESISFTANPSVVEPDAGEKSGYYETASYYLSSQHQAEHQTTTQTSSPSYTYAQVSGTTNELSSSFTLSGTTPSGDIYSDYGGTLTTTFTPSITVDNPYYTYKQNELFDGEGTLFNVAVIIYVPTCEYW